MEKAIRAKIKWHKSTEIPTYEHNYLNMNYNLN